MNWDQVEGKWEQVKGAVKSKWGKLTDQDLTIAEGKRDILVGKIQERYGVLKDDAERQIDTWLSGFGQDQDQDQRKDRPQRKDKAS